MTYDLSTNIAKLSEAIASEIKNLKDKVNTNAISSGPFLFDHITVTLDKPPTIISITYTRLANTKYKKTIELSMYWKSVELRKYINLYTENIYNNANIYVDDSLYNVYIPYDTTICEQSSPGVFDIILCRKAFQ